MDKVLNSKQRWAARHVQIKITVSPEIADKFKTKCLEEGTSMTSKLKSFMDGTTRYLTVGSLLQSYLALDA